MIFHYSDHSLRMPVTSSSSTKIIHDPALRCGPPSAPMSDSLRKQMKKSYKVYKDSEIKLPAIWSWERLPRVKLGEPILRSWHDIKLLRATTPYYPFTKEVYTSAIGKIPCNWSHIVHAENKESDCSYSWPCGCKSPAIEYTEFKTDQAITTARIVSKEDSRIYHLVPCMPVFAQGVPQKKKRRRKSNLTDSRTYSRLKRTRNTSSANVVKGCSKQLQEPDSD